jgi:hypothetical protein
MKLKKYIKKYGKEKVGRAISNKGSDKIAGCDQRFRYYLSSDPKDDPRGPKEER